MGTFTSAPAVLGSTLAQHPPGQDEVSQDGNDVESATELLSGGPDVRVLFSIQTAAHLDAVIPASYTTCPPRLTALVVKHDS